MPGIARAPTAIRRRFPSAFSRTKGKATPNCDSPAAHLGDLVQRHKGLGDTSHDEDLRYHESVAGQFRVARFSPVRQQEITGPAGEPEGAACEEEDARGLENHSQR